MNADGEKRNQRRTLSSYFTAEWKMLVVVTLTGIVYNIGLTATPWFEGQLAQRLADIIGGSRLASSMAPLALAYVLVVAFVQLMRFLKRLSVRKFANGVNLRMKQELYAGLLGLSHAEVAQAGVGEVMTKAASDVDDCVEGMRKFTTEIFDTGVALVAYLVMLLVYDWRLALLSIVFIPVSYVLAARLRGMVTRRTAAAKASMSQLNAATLDRVEGALTYRVFGLEAQRDRAYEERLADYERTEGIANILTAAPQPLYRVISMAGIFFVIVFGARNVLGAGWVAWDIAAFTTFTSCFIRLATKSSSAAKLFNAVQRARVSWERIRPLLQHEEGQLVPMPTAAGSIRAGSIRAGSIRVATLRGGFVGERAETMGKPAPFTLPIVPVRLEVCGLSVSYDGVEVVSDVSFSLDPGQIIGVTGGVASGKSALGKAFLCEQPYGGHIFFGGCELADLMRDRVSVVGYLGHDPELLSASIEDNVAMGVPGDVWRALRMVKLDEEVAAFPDGVSTLVGDGGVRLSGGQRARLGLARALYHLRPIIVLDDPFSAVDMTTESQIIANMRELLSCSGSDASIILISHRLTHFSELDGVVFLENGRAVVGTHAELMSGCPSYARLVELQSVSQSQVQQHTQPQVEPQTDPTGDKGGEDNGGR